LDLGLIDTETGYRTIESSTSTKSPPSSIAISHRSLPHSPPVS